MQAHLQSEDILRNILEANATYAEAFSQSDPLLLAKLAKGQSPRICWLGCSDSRVSAELYVLSRWGQRWGRADGLDGIVGVPAWHLDRSLCT